MSGPSHKTATATQGTVGCLSEENTAEKNRKNRTQTKKVAGIERKTTTKTRRFWLASRARASISMTCSKLASFSQRNVEKRL